MIKIICLLSIFLLNAVLFSQENNSLDSLLKRGRLKDCVEYALDHQSLIQQSLLDEQITDHEINSKLADWFPQINLNMNLTHSYKLPVTIFQGNPVNVGLLNTSGVDFSLTQTIFDRDVFLASSTSKEISRLMKQKTAFNKIDIVAIVSKAFYSVLFTQEQIALLEEDIIRLKQSVKDTYNQYKSGIVDKTDYQRATIAFNNAEAELTQNRELLIYRSTFLKKQMGYPIEAGLNIEFDTTKMQNEIFIDTTQKVIIENRIEYQLLHSQIMLQEANLTYNDLSFVPSLSAFANYNFNYQNDNLSKLYRLNYPNSNIGLELSFPIFQGGKRIQEIELAGLELKRYSYSLISLKDSINSEYVSALGEYKSSLNNYNILKENLNLAKDVYNTIQLQYKSGIKTYLEVITAENDLRTTQTNYNNALFQLLSSKLDLEKALGTIQY
jgi:outer membrane protein TolC